MVHHWGSGQRGGGAGGRLGRRGQWVFGEAEASPRCGILVIAEWKSILMVNQNPLEIWQTKTKTEPKTRTSWLKGGQRRWHLCRTSAQCLAAGYSAVTQTDVRGKNWTHRAYDQTDGYRGPSSVEQPQRQRLGAASWQVSKVQTASVTRFNLRI